MNRNKGFFITVQAKGITYRKITNEPKPIHLPVKQNISLVLNDDFVGYSHSTKYRAHDVPLFNNHAIRRENLCVDKRNNYYYLLIPRLVIYLNFT